MVDLKVFDLLCSELSKELHIARLDLDSLKDKTVHIKPVYGEAMPAVFINASEAGRLLKVSPPTLIGYVKYGLIKEHKNEVTRGNKFLLEEILWLMTQRYFALNLGDLTKLAHKRTSIFG